jgi:hypothetical protein
VALIENELQPPTLAEHRALVIRLRMNRFGQLLRTNGASLVSG